MAEEQQDAFSTELIQALKLTTIKLEHELNKNGQDLSSLADIYRFIIDNLGELKAGLSSKSLTVLESLVFEYDEGKDREHDHAG
jgi:hypothetical protein